MKWRLDAQNVSVGLGAALDADPCQIENKYCCIRRCSRKSRARGRMGLLGQVRPRYVPQKRVGSATLMLHQRWSLPQTQ